MRIYLTETKSPYSVESLSTRIKETYLSSENQQFIITDEIADADLIIFWENYEEGEQTRNQKLREQALLIGEPEKLFVVSAEDRPSGFMPGIYTGTPLCPWRTNRFLTGGYFWTMNPHLEVGRINAWDPKYLFSFRGALTAPVRREIFRIHSSNGSCLIEETENLKFTINVEDPLKAQGQREYRDTILDSKFVLCPRGGGDSSYRLFETMQLGRVPIILSDRWIPPLGPAWGDFSIRIAEKRVPELDIILRTFEDRAKEMGLMARKAWEEWFRPEILPLRTFQWIHHLALARTHRESSIRKYWPLLDWMVRKPSPLPVQAYSKVARVLKAKGSSLSLLIPEI